MKAIFISKYGGPEVLQYRNLPTPSPKDEEVLVKINAAAVNSTDPVFRKGKPFISRLFTGILKPKHQIPGDVLAGEIVETGENVTRFKLGDRVYGYSSENLGAHAEYICLPEDAAVSLIPENIGFREAAGIVDGGHTAFVFLHHMGKSLAGRKILINGVSGSVGIAALQIAIAQGAEVTGVCSTSNMELITSMGAQRVIDYTKTDFTREEPGYDIIFDTVANKSFSRCRNVLTENGVYLTTFPRPAVVLRGIFQSKNTGKRAFFIAAGIKPAKEKIETLNCLSELMEAGKLRTIISREFPLDQAAEAHEYVETGHKVGNVILNIS